MPDEQHPGEQSATEVVQKAKIEIRGPSSFLQTSSQALVVAAGLVYLFGFIIVSVFSMRPTESPILVSGLKCERLGLVRFSSFPRISTYEPTSYGCAVLRLPLQQSSSSQIINVEFYLGYPSSSHVDVSVSHQ